MSFSRFRPATIRTRILYALLGTAVLSLVCFGLVSLWSMHNLGRSSLKGTVGLSQELLKISKGSLETLSQDGLLKATVDQAALIDTQFRDVENDLKVLINIAERLWKHPGIYPRKRSFSIHEQPSEPGAASVWQIPRGVSSASIATELQLSSAMDDFMIAVLKSNAVINDCNLATPQGLFRRFPWSANIDPAYDVRTRDWFKRALETGALGWSEPYVGVIARNLRVNCSAPVMKNGKAVAVIGLNVPLTTIQDRIIRMRINNQGRAYLVSQDRRILAREGLDTNSDQWKEKQTGTFFSFDDQQAMPQLDKNLASGTPGIMRGILNKQDSFVAYAPISTTGWSVLFALPVEAVYAPIRPTEQAIVAEAEAAQALVYRHIGLSLAVLTGVFLLILAGIAVISRRMAEKITEPILELEDGAAIIGNGNLEHRLQIKTGDEIQQLGETFNRMAADLATHIRSLTETTAAKERIQSELKLATDIQASLLPRIFPPFPDRTDIELFALMDPAKEVGGDFYDFFFVDDQRICLIIGDVSDKGVPAALYMMVAKTLLKSEALRDADPAQVLERVNAILSLDNESSMFVTVFCAVLDTATGRLACANAGHLPPLLLQPGEAAACRRFNPGFVLGPMPGISYQTEQLTLQPGDLFLLYTDGVNEAVDQDKNEFGDQRLLDCVTRTGAGRPEEMIRAIRTEVQQFANGAPQSDDITMLAIRYLGRTS
jgi:sigma-B regulation protein RsbU (phosphoserine phosphatase)